MSDSREALLRHEAAVAEGSRMKTDTELRADVLEELEWDPRVNATRISVAACHGVVTLSGSVQSYFEKTEAVRAARRVASVAALTDDLVVKNLSIAAPTDAEIAAAVAQALRSNTNVPTGAVQAAVHQGHVTLQGEVHRYFHREAAEDAVRPLRGVTAVTNSIQLMARRPAAADAKQRIERAFSRRADLDAQRIFVHIERGTVVLEGVVTNVYERDAAEDAAWSADGVTSVEDRIRVEPSTA